MPSVAAIPETHPRSIGPSAPTRNKNGRAIAAVAAALLTPTPLRDPLPLCQEAGIHRRTTGDHNDQRIFADDIVERTQELREKEGTETAFWLQAKPAFIFRR
jgi:hypothetical protein